MDNNFQADPRALVAFVQGLLRMESLNAEARCFYRSFDETGLEIGDEITSWSTVRGSVSSFMDGCTGDGVEILYTGDHFSNDRQLSNLMAGNLRSAKRLDVLNLDVDSQTLGVLLPLRFPDRTATDAGIQFDERVFFVSISPSAVEYSNSTAYGDVIKAVVTLILCDRTEGDDGTLTGSWRSSLFSGSTGSTSVGA